MRIIVLSQVYWPDTASTAQHLTDLTEVLARMGHQVTVFSSRRQYEDPTQVFSGQEHRLGVDVRRLWQSGFGKRTVAGRLTDFATFNLSLCWRLLGLKATDVDIVLGMTSPPLVSFLGTLIARHRGWRFCFWAMDLQPELAIQAGMVREGSWTARALDAMGRYVFRSASRIVALDSYMAAHIRERGAAPGSVSVEPVWPVAAAVWAGARLDNPFRLRHGFGKRFVVMYSGNHAVVHPLDTLLEAALLLRDDQEVLFVFVGGGVRSREVTKFRHRHSLENIVQLPYQPREDIHISLAAADLHVVIMGNGQVGYTHPNKVYGAMFAARPFVYIGPQPSHVTDLIDQCPGNLSVPHGDGQGLAAALVAFRAAGEEAWRAVGVRNAELVSERMDPGKLTQSMAQQVARTGC